MLVACQRGVGSWHLVERVLGYRIFADVDGRMNRSGEESGGAVLLVSQFTLYADTRKGRRPSWSAAAPGPVAEPLVAAVRAQLTQLGVAVETGVFGADMRVELVNDGPITLILDS